LKKLLVFFLTFNGMMGTTHLNEQQVLKAAIAMLKFVEKQKEDAQKADDQEQLFEEVENIYLYFTIYRKTEGPMRRAKFRSNIVKKIPIKHSMMLDKEICLIAGLTDNDKKRAIQMLEEIPVPQVKRVLHAKELRERFCQHKDKKALCDAYDFFIAEDRIIPTIVHDLGRYFFDRRKQPYGMRLRGAFQKRIMKLLYCTFLLKPKGGQMSVKIGTDKFTAQQITDNVMMGIEEIVVKYIPGGWGMVKKIGLKTLKSPYLVIYQALLPEQKGPKKKKKKSKKKNSKSTANDETMTTQSIPESTEKETEIKGENKQKAMQPKEEDKMMDTESREEDKTKTVQSIGEDKKMASESVEEDNKMKTGSD